MSVKYLPTIKHETEFQGEKVVATMEPMDRGTFLKIQSSLARARELPSENEQIAAIYVVACEVLDVSLQKVEGLTDVANTPITKEVLLSKVFFGPLVRELFSSLLDHGNAGKVSSSESEGKSPA